jgi:hypothetical protein
MHRGAVSVSGLLVALVLAAGATQPPAAPPRVKIDAGVAEGATWPIAPGAAAFESPTLVVIGEGPGYWTRLRAVLDAGRVTGPRVHDARIAALCLDHGVSELWSADRDFSRFPDLRVVNPLPPSTAAAPCGGAATDE